MNMIWNQLSKHRDLGLLILRLGFGLGFLFFHGWGKIVGGPERWQGVGGAMSNFGINFGHTFFGFLAAFAESAGGLLIALGLFYRPILAMLGFTMFTAAINHIVSGQGTPAHAFKNLFVCIGLMPFGPGKYSVDAMLEKNKQEEAMPV